MCKSERRRERQCLANSLSRERKEKLYNNCVYLYRALRPVNRLKQVTLRAEQSVTNSVVCARSESECIICMYRELGVLVGCSLRADDVKYTHFMLKIIHQSLTSSNGGCSPFDGNNNANTNGTKRVSKSCSTHIVSVCGCVFCDRIFDAHQKLNCVKLNHLTVNQCTASCMLFVCEYTSDWISSSKTGDSVHKICLVFERIRFGSTHWEYSQYLFGDALSLAQAKQMIRLACTAHANERTRVKV